MDKQRHFKYSPEIRELWRITKQKQRAKQKGVQNKPNSENKQLEEAFLA